MEQPQEEATQSESGKSEPKKKKPPTEAELKAYKAARVAVGKAIRERRKEKKLSLEDLAEASGLSVTFVGELERAAKDPSLKSLQLISKALETPITVLVAKLDEARGVYTKAEVLELLKPHLRESYSVEEASQLVDRVKG